MLALLSFKEYIFVFSPKVQSFLYKDQLYGVNRALRILFDGFFELIFPVRQFFVVFFRFILVWFNSCFKLFYFMI